MRVSGARQRNRRNASPENFVSATNAGRPPKISTTTAHGEKPASSTAKLVIAIAFWNRPGGAHDQRQRPARGFAPCARELVVELRILEVRELERQRLLEDHHVDAVGELGLEQRLAQRDAAVRGRDDDQRECLHEHPAEDWSDVHVAVGGMDARRDDHAVDDSCTDPGDQRGQHAGQHGDKTQKKRESAAGAPEKLQRALAIAENAEKLPRGVQGFAMGGGLFGDAGLGDHVCGRSVP